MNRDHRWNEINGRLNGKEVFLLGGGSSLKGFDFNKLDKKIVLAVNHSIEYYPKAGMLIVADKIFFKYTTFDVTKYKGLLFISEKCKGTPPITEMWKAEKDNLYIYEDRRDEPTLNAKVGLFHPTSAGMQAITLALQMRAKHIYLMGYDYYKNNGNMHFYPDYEHHKRYDGEKMKQKLCKFSRFEPYYKKITNLNPDSLIEEFPKKRLSDIFD